MLSIENKIYSGKLQIELNLLFECQSMQAP